MKIKLISLAMVLAVLIAMIGISPAQAVSYGTQFTTSITYQNVGTGPATILLDFYSETNGSPISISVPDLAVNAGSSIYMGSVTQVAAGFKGSAVMSSSQPLVATLVQLPTGTTTVKNRPLSNGFSAGAPYVLIPTVLRNSFSTNSIFSVQNVDSVGADLTINFVPTSGSTISTTVTNLPSGAAKYFDLGSMTSPALGSSFNGSVQIFAKKTGTQTDSSVIATSLELSTANDNVYAFEGVSQSGTKVYMPSALCNYNSQNSSYAVQNTDAAATASVSVTYSNGKTDGPYSVAPGKKTSFPGCGVSNSLNPAGFIGSATINTVGGSIVAVGKIYGGGLSTAFVGFTSGSEKVALPYVRWSQSSFTATGGRQRAYIAIQNVGTGTIPANTLSVKYYDKDGNLQGTDIIKTDVAVGGKTNSNPMNVNLAEFGYYGSSIGGSAVVQGPAGSKLAVIVRVTSMTTAGTVGEDYNGIPLQ